MSNEYLLQQPISITALEEKLIAIYSQATPSSLEEMREFGVEAEDNNMAQDNAYGNISILQMQACLTEKQQRVLCLIKEGKSPEEIASYMMISKQAVYQITPRIRKRLKRYGN
jgi:DNA-binding CsgD family transcriptional regulator